MTVLDPTRDPNRAIAAELWIRHRRPILITASALMAAGGLYRLGVAYARLLFNYKDWANIDIRFFHRLVDAWFAGEPLQGSVYPPATYALLWPFLGWLEISPARWLWGITSLAALCWLAALIARESRADTPLERTAWALLPFAAYATSATVGNGQLGIHVLAPLLGGMLLLRSRPAAWPSDLAAAAMILFALVKPTLSAPLFWIVLVSFARGRPAALVMSGYGALTLLALMFRTRVSTLAPVVQDSIRSGVEGAAVGSAETGGGYANIHDWLTGLGLERWNLPASLLILAALGVWTFRHRRGDLFVLMGVSALVARFWVYHRLHDDLLLFVPMLALGRLAHDPNESWRVTSGVLLGVLWISALAPANLLFAPFPWGRAFDVSQTIIWGSALVFLICVEHRRN